MIESEEDILELWFSIAQADTQPPQWSNPGSPFSSLSYPDLASSFPNFTLSRSNTGETILSDNSTNTCSSCDENRRSSVQANASMQSYLNSMRQLEFPAPPLPPRPAEEQQVYHDQAWLESQELSIPTNSPTMNAYNEQQHMLAQHLASNRTCTLNPPHRPVLHQVCSPYINNINASRELRLYHMKLTT